MFVHDVSDRNASVYATILALVLTFAAGAVSAHGVTEKEIFIGRTAGFTGQIAAPVKENTQGAMLYIDWVNKNGGVYGRKIVIEAMDDGFEPKRAAENAKTLVELKDVLALFLNRGTPHTEAILPMAVKHGVPIIAPSTGANLLHEPVNPLVFNVRSRYQTESEKAILQLVTTGITRIALIHVDDSFGKDGAAGAQRGFVRANVRPVLVATYDRTTANTEEVAQATINADPQAVIIISSQKALASFVHQIRRGGATAQVISISNVSTGTLVKDLGEYAHGVMVTQVFPNPASGKTIIAREFRKLANSDQSVPLSYAAMEGFAAAKVLVEGLRRAGPAPTRRKLITALESLHNFDLGDVMVSYGPKDRTGSDYVSLSIIDRRGGFAE